MAKAPVVRVPTNPSLKAGVSDGLIVRLSSRRSLNWALSLTVPDLQSVGQQTCSDYLLSIPNCSTHRRDAKRKKLGGWAEERLRFPSSSQLRIFSTFASF